MSSSPSKSFNKYRKKISVTKSDTIGDFKIGSKIGQGTFSKVCMGIHIPTGEKVAIKILPKNQIKEKKDKIRIEKEINIQKKLHHQNIIHQYSVLDTDTSIYIITEYCSGGELFDYIVSKRRLPEVEACRIFQQLINGLEYLHKQKICHRDLKPENLLFDSKKNLKIADFGLSNEYLYGKLGTPCGSPCYAAPEMVTGQKYMGDTVDIWSSGIVLYSMVCGYLPFEDEDQTVLFHKIAKGLFTLPGYLSYKCKDLIKNILVTNPNKRYGFNEIKKHPWFMSVNNISGKNNLFNSPGIIIDQDVIPIDINIIKEMYFAKEYKNFSISNIISAVLKNKHNKITTAYYLILKKKLRKNIESVSDINSNSKLFIEYMKKPISKMSFWNNDYDKIVDYYTEKVKEIININRKKESPNKKKIDLPNLNIDNDDIIIYKEKEGSITDEKRLIKNNKYNENKIKIKTESKNKNNETNLETIVYNEETEKNEKNNNEKKNNADIVRNNLIFSNDTDEEYHGYKLTNYELDSEETIKDINSHSLNKKQFNELLKTNDNNTIEERNNINNNNNQSRSSNEISLDKIIKEEQNSINLNRNKKNDKNRINSGIESTDLKEISITNNHKKNNYTKSNDKTEKNKYVYNNIIIGNKNIKVYNKENINNRLNLTGMSNNSYLYKKLRSLIAREDKINKFINKKPKNKDKNNGRKAKIKNNLVLNNGNKNFGNYKKINLNLNFNNRRLQTQEQKNIHINDNYINTTFSGTNSYKNSNSHLKVIDEYNTKINNNIKVQNINNYIIDVHKYKINLIGNSNYYKDLNVLEFYKKFNNPNRYNKFILNSNKKKVPNKNINISNNNDNEYKSNYSNHINNNKRSINKYLSNENNNSKLSKIRHLSDLDISPNHYANYHLKTESYATNKSSNKNNKENYINLNRNIKMNDIKQKIIKSKSDEKDKISNKLKLEKKIKKYSPFQLRSEQLNKVKNKIKILNRNKISNKNSNSKNKTFFSNSMPSENITFKKQHIQNKSDNYSNTEINSKNETQDKKIRNLKYLSIINSKNKNSMEPKEAIYHKKFINLNKRKNNSLENEYHKKKYNLEMANLNNINHQNYSLISLYTNQIRNGINIEKIKKKIINNLSNINNNSSTLKENKDTFIRKRHYISQEKPKKFYQIKPYTNLGILKDKNLINISKNMKINKNTEKENVKSISATKDKNYINNINKMSSLICCKCSISKIKEVVKKAISTKLYLGNNKNSPIINTFYSNSSVVLRCRLVDKLYNLYFELNISVVKDSQKYLLIKPNLLKGNKSFFMKLFEEIKNELIN